MTLHAAWTSVTGVCIEAHVARLAPTAMSCVGDCWLEVHQIVSQSPKLSVQRVFDELTKAWFPLGVDCRRRVKNSLFLYLVLCAERAKLNRETKNFSPYA